MIRAMLLGYVLAALSVLTSTASLADDAAMLRQAQDRAEIQALMWRYVRALDTLDADAYARVFTENGQFGAAENATQGRAALREMIKGLEAGRAEREAESGESSPPMHHVITNAHIEFLGENRARYHSYWMTVFGAQGQSTPPRVAAAGRGVDELVRVDGEWLIESRNVAPDN